MWGWEAVALEKQFTKKKKEKREETNKQDLDDLLRREGAGHLSQVIV